MKKIIFTLLVAVAFVGCEPTDDERAAQLMQQIETLYSQGDYATTLDSIRSLRAHYPKALQSRKRAFVLWQQSSLKQAQAEVLRADSLLQLALEEQRRATSLMQRNMLGVKIDSLTTRRDAQSMIVRAVKKKMREAATDE